MKQFSLASMLKKRLGIVFVDWTLSVFWVMKEAEPDLVTPIGRLPQPEKSIGFTIGPFLISLDRDGDSVFMLAPFVTNWTTKLGWIWGAAATMMESSDLEADIVTAPYSRETILPPEPIFNSRGALLTSKDIEALKRGSGNEGPDTWLDDEDIASLHQFAKEHPYNPRHEV